MFMAPVTAVVARTLISAALANAGSVVSASAAQTRNNFFIANSKALSRGPAPQFAFAIFSGAINFFTSHGVVISLRMIFFVVLSQ